MSSDSDAEHRRFWKQLLDHAKGADVMTHVARPPSSKSWITAPTGKRGIYYAYAISLTQAWVKAELVMESPEKARNKEIFDLLHAQKGEIEGSFGGPLEWHRLDDVKRSRICRQVDRPHLRDEATWDEAQTIMIQMMKRLSTAMSPFIEGISP